MPQDSHTAARQTSHSTEVTSKVADIDHAAGRQTPPKSRRNDSRKKRHSHAFIDDLPDVVSVAVVQEAATHRLLQRDPNQHPAIIPGRTGGITTTIHPACLRLLTGTVQQPNRTQSSFDFLLDETSTEQLRRDPSNTRFPIPDHQKRYRLAKVPATCIELTDTPGDS
ncbi:hypothetical protein [Streptomyces sp. SAI-170]|uniref:hypothetical protein n=1 Tax=Streptomyces sp. SAI-170 TaxID=3377729 RepID=UPI003C7D9906